MFLHLLRHAHAGDWSTWDGPDDARPLTDKGRAQCDRLARFLKARGFAPEVFVTSPKARAAQTAELVADHLGIRVVVDERLGGGLGVGVVEAILRDHGDPERPVLVGHDPDFSDLVVDLTGSTGIVMRKGALARIEVDRPLASGAGELRWLVPPDLLKPER